MPNAKQKKSTQVKKELSWQDRTIQIEFSVEDRATIQAWVNAESASPSGSALSVVDSGYSIKCNFSDYYGAYTISIGCSKEHTHFPKHNFWFVFSDLYGSWVVSRWVCEYLLDTGEGYGGVTSDVDDWLTI